MLILTDLKFTRIHLFHKMKKWFWIGLVKVETKQEVIKKELICINISHEDIAKTLWLKRRANFTNTQTN